MFEKRGEMPAGADKQSTRERLIEAAGRLFAEKGFAGATVREICDAAGANVAAVNYHFHDKEALYAEVVAHVLRGRTERFPMDRGLGEAASPEARLRAFVRGFLCRRFDRTRPAWWGTLLAREMRKPCQAVRWVIDKERKGNRRLLSSIIQDLLGPGADTAEVELCSASVFGQVLMYVHGHHVSLTAFRGENVTPEKVEELARHITDFSLGGIAHLRRAREAGSGGPRKRVRKRSATSRP